MDVFKIGVKIFAAEGFAPADGYVPIFQRWIQNQSVPGHRLIDVADYAHVSAGPGTVLVSSEANFHLDHGENRIGLLYVRKLPEEGTFAIRLRAAVAEALKAALRLEQEPELSGKLKFRTDEILIRLNDRLLAPPGEQTVEAAKKDVEAVAKRLFGQGAEVSTRSGAEKLAEFVIKSKQPAVLAVLLAKI